MPLSRQDKMTGRYKIATLKHSNDSLNHIWFYCFFGFEQWSAAWQAYHQSVAPSWLHLESQTPQTTKIASNRAVIFCFVFFGSQCAAQFTPGEVLVPSSSVW